MPDRAASISRRSALPERPVPLKKTFHCVARLATLRLKPARPVPLYLPVRVVDGKVQGVPANSRKLHGAAE